MRLTLFFVTFISVQFLSAQVNVSGVVLDKSDNSALAGVGVVLLKAKDSTFVKGVATDENGKFTMSVTAGKYLLKYTYLSYKTQLSILNVKNENIALPNILLAEDVKELKGVTIEKTAVRAVQKGDTTEYNSAAFKTNKDASTEDLIQKMPGITVENGTVKAKGEEIKKVLVDGKPFFGDDPSTALKNLPAEAVDKIQVYDQQSDQSRFTGFNDGNDQRAINIITKPNMNNGVFGKVYAGYGYINASRYSAGATVNWFNGNRRISVLAMSNNINQQNFAMDDLMGLSGSSGAGRMRGGRMRPGMLQNSPAGNFMVGQQGGITTSQAVGINYSDQWSNKVKVSGSYFFNLTDNKNSSETNRQYFAQGDSTTDYKETSASTTRNMNHRLNFRFEYAIDSNNALFITPKLSIQQYNQKSNLDGISSLKDGNAISSLSSNYSTKNFGYNGSLDLLFQHKFAKAGRTFSVGLTGNLNNSDGDATLISKNSFAIAQDTTELNQKTDNSTRNYSGSANFAYTEPINDLSMMQFTYTPNYSWSKRDKSTFNKDTVTENYNQRNLQLSSNFENTYMTHKVGFDYRLKTKTDKINFSIGAEMQYALLTGKQLYPNVSDVKKSFNNLLPNATFKYNFSKQGNIRINYSTSTTPPSISQMQNVIDNSNPLLISTGNPNLKQNYQHIVSVRFNNMDHNTMRGVFGFVSFTYTQNYIGNSTIIALRDTLLQNNVMLNAGSQLTKPVNLSNSLGLRSFFGYGMPVKALKSNLNFHAGITYSRTPSLINGITNTSNTMSAMGGFVLGSNINEKIDFTIRYMGNYNVVKNSLRQQQNNNYYSHNANASFNWNFWKGFVFNTSIDNTVYAGVSQGFNQNFFLWNASLAYKFLKDRSLEVKGSVFDILGQNSSISRTVNETYLEDVRTQVLQRYFLVTITYNLKYFKQAKAL